MSQNTNQQQPKQAVAVLQPSRLPIAPQVAKEFNLDATQWRVLVDQIFPSAKTVEAVTMALSYCRARKLDIYKRPVHIVPMYSTLLKRMVETVWPGISEIRTTASRTGEYAGIDAVQFGPVLEKTFEGVTGYDNDQQRIEKTVRYPEWASVVVYRKVQGERVPFHAMVFWEETYATIGKTEVPNDMWAKRPSGQLMKCVEAAALRMAFPEEIGNTYAAEEMEGRSIDVGSEAAAIPAQATRTIPPPVPEDEPTEDEVRAEEKPAEPEKPKDPEPPKPKATRKPKAEPAPQAEPHQVDDGGGHGNQTGDAQPQTTVVENTATGAAMVVDGQGEVIEEEEPDPAPPEVPSDDEESDPPEGYTTWEGWWGKLAALSEQAGEQDALDSVFEEMDVYPILAGDEPATERANAIYDEAKARIAAGITAERQRLEADGQGSLIDELPEDTKQAVRLGNTP